MKICFVTAFPPSQLALNEYGFHVARELQSDPVVSLTILGDELDSSQPEPFEFNVLRCWKMNHVANHWKLLKALREIPPKVVWFNLIFSSFGNKDNPLAALSGLPLPVTTRMACYHTHVTLDPLQGV